MGTLAQRVIALSFEDVRSSLLLDRWPLLILKLVEIALLMSAWLLKKVRLMLSASNITLPTLTIFNSSLTLPGMEISTRVSS
jgi:hypothetical protein